MSADSGYSSSDRKKVNSELMKQGLVGLACIVTAERFHWQYQQDAYATVVSDLETDRAQASGIEAWHPRVQRGMKWLHTASHTSGLEKGGTLRAIANRYLPALFGADLNTTPGKAWWTATVGLLPCDMPAVKNEAGRPVLLLKCLELLRTAERTCIVMLQDAGAPNGCGTRLAAVPGGGAEALGVPDAEEFLAGIVRVTGLTEQQVFDTWTVAADVRPPPRPRPHPPPAPLPASPTLPSPPDPRPSTAQRPGCDFGVLLRLARRSGKDVEYTDFSDSGCFPNNSVYASREVLPPPAPLPPPRLRKQAGEPPPHPPWRAQVTISVGEQLSDLFKYIKDCDEAVECIVGWRDLNGFLVQEVLYLSKRDFESPPSHQNKVGSRDANGCIEYLQCRYPACAPASFGRSRKGARRLSRPSS